MIEKTISSFSKIEKKWLAMMGVGIGVFMATLDSSIVNISLPTLMEDLHSDFSTISWVVLSYVLVLTSLMLGFARLGDMYDKKKLYGAGLAIFTISSLLCGIAPSVGWLIAFRAIQGLGAAMTQALGSAIITEIFPAKERGRALGIMGTTVSTGIAIGPPLGGLLIGLLGWRSVFLVNVPIGIIAVLVVMRVVPSSHTQPGQRFDVAGAPVLFFTLACYAFGMTLWQELGGAASLTRGLLIAAIVGLVIFLLLELRLSQPMIELRLFRDPLFSMSLLMGFLVFVVMSGSYIMPFFLEIVKGFSVQTVGLILMAQPIAMGLVAPIAGSLSDRFGSRGISLVGLASIIIGCLAISTLRSDTSAIGFVVRLIPLGLGMGMFQSPNNSAIMGSVPRERLGVASGLLSLSRTLGSTTGVPLMGTLFTAMVLSFAAISRGSDITLAPPEALVAGINGTYRTAALIIFASFLLAAAAMWLEKRMSKKIKTVKILDLD